MEPNADQPEASASKPGSKPDRKGDLAWLKTMLGARFCAATHPRRRVKTVSGGLRGKDAPALSLAGHYLMAMPGMLFIVEKRRKGEK